jgi:hypothetical protein
MSICADLGAGIADHKQFFLENIHVDQTPCRFNSRPGTPVPGSPRPAKAGRLLCGRARLLPGEFALLSRCGKGGLLPEGAKVLFGRKGLLHRGSQKRCEGFGFARRSEDLLLCDEDHGESRCPTRRLLHSEARLLRRKIGLLFERRETRLLQVGTEVLCRQQGLLQRHSEVN